MIQYSILFSTGRVLYGSTNTAARRTRHSTDQQQRMHQRARHESTCSDRNIIIKRWLAVCGPEVGCCQSVKREHSAWEQPPSPHGLQT